MLSPETSPTGKSNSTSAQGEVGSNSWDMKTSTSLGLRTHKLASDCNKDTTKTELQEVTSSISKEVFFGLRSIPIFNIPSLLSSFI